MRQTSLLGFFLLYSQNFKKHGSDVGFLPVTPSVMWCLMKKTRNLYEFGLNSISVFSFFGWARKNKLVRIQMHWSVLLLFLFFNGLSMIYIFLSPLKTLWIWIIDKLQPTMVNCICSLQICIKFNKTTVSCTFTAW